VYCHGLAVLQRAERNRRLKEESGNKKRKGNRKRVNLLYFQPVDPINLKHSNHFGQSGEGNDTKRKETEI
jgi:hypothetical protein